MIFGAMLEYRNSLRRALPSLLCFTLASGFSRIVAAAESTNFVTPVSIEHLVQNPADLFDLEGKTVRFTPSGDDSYKVETISGVHLIQCNRLLKNEDASGPAYANGWSVPIPFSFPFGDKKWNHLYVNVNGNISFEQPESAYWPERDPWADGGMCSVAAAIDSRSVAGMEKMIAVFWGNNTLPKTSRMSFRTNRNSIAITWNVSRMPWGQAVSGENTFQARLYSSGVIEFAYPKIAERDGIVGLFPGKAVAGKQLAHWVSNATAVDPSVDIDSADVYDAGSVLDLAITMKHDALTNVDSGSLEYGCSINHDGWKDPVSVSVSDKQSMSCWLLCEPLTGGWHIEGHRVDMFVSKVLLAGCQTCSVAWGTAWRGKPGRFTGSGDDLPPFDMSHVSPGTIKLSQAHEAHSGNIFEVFHYPVITRSSERLLKSIYQKEPPQDDIALVFTDFRIDDLFGKGPGAGAVNFSIQGIGDGNANPRSTKDIGSTNLQMSISPVWLGSAMFDETGTFDDGVKWFNFAQAVNWITHECMHRWGLDMSFINPATGKKEKLTDNNSHWREELDTTAMFPVGDMFQEQKGLGKSVIGGFSWFENADHTYSESNYSYGIPGGLSALDLYVMGLLPPEKVPPTFILENFKQLEWNKFEGTPVQFKIADVIAAMGERKPVSAEAQKVYQMRFYIAREPGRDPDPAMVERAQKLSVIVADFFSRATGGVMKIVPSGSVVSEKKSTIQQRTRGRRRRRLNNTGT